jgi:hypothetical protein
MDDIILPYLPKFVELWFHSFDEHLGKSKCLYEQKNNAQYFQYYLAMNPIWSLSVGWVTHVLFIKPNIFFAREALLFLFI